MILAILLTGKVDKVHTEKQIKEWDQGMTWLKRTPLAWTPRLNTSGSSMCAKVLQTAHQSLNPHNIL